MRLLVEKSQKHSALVHPIPFKEQPKGRQMGKITNDLKKAYSEQLTATKILDYFGKGHSIMLADAQTDHDNSFSFISSSLFAIDIDDDNYITDPEEVMAKLRDKITGLFYTFSHGKKGNRYRLFYQLDKKITDERQMKGIIELVANDLKKLGLPVDTQAKNPMQIVRGGQKSVLVDAENKLNTDELLKRVKEESLKRQKELYDEFEKELRPVPFESLKEMAEKVGHIPSGMGQGDLWKRLVLGIKHYANSGYITQDEGFELFDIVSGGEQPAKAWDKLRASGQATIKSLIYEAIKLGYKGKYIYYGNDEEPEQEYEFESVKVKQYIPVDVAMDIVKSKQRILVDSPTGSGKTTAFIKAFKELASNRNHFYIFAAPTIALTEQTANENKVRAIKGRTNNLFKMVNQDIRNGKRVFVATYDMAPVLVDFLRTTDERSTFTLVVDELHKFVTDYDTNYRFIAIQNLYKLSRSARTFIGLSGTIDDIYKNDFDKVIKIDNGFPQSPCQELAVYTYEKKKDALTELTKLIEVWSSKRRLLIYIQSKDKIKQLQEILRKKGLKVRTISANEKKNPTYKKLVEASYLDNDVQVLLTTSVIADGVNILNVQRDEKGNVLKDKNDKPVADVDWEVVAVCNEFSSLFNYSSIKQISNRLRMEYRRFSLFMQEPKAADQQPFRLECAYQYKLENATNITEELNSSPYFDMRLFRASVIEKKYGIYAAIGELKIDTLFLRHAVSKEQERYYTKYRFAFVSAIEKALHVNSAGILNISKEIRDKNLELTFIRDILGQLAEQKKEAEQEKIESIAKEFNRKVYQAFIDEDKEILEEFKKNVSLIHYSTLKRVTRIASFETCKKIIAKVTTKKAVNSYYDDISSLVDVCYMQSIHRPTKTRQVLFALLELNEFITVAEYKEAVVKIAKKCKIEPKLMKGVEKMVVVESARNKSERMKRVASPITVEAIAKKHGLTVEEVKDSALRLAKSQGKTVETAVRNQLFSR